MEMGLLVPDLLYGHMAVGFSQKGMEKGKRKSKEVIKKGQMN